MRVFSLTRLTSRERLVVGLLRRADSVTVDTRLAASFQRLRSVLRKLGFRRGPEASTCATAHEICMLGLLAGLQRRQIDVGIELDPLLRSKASRCADSLEACGIHLRHSAFVRLTRLPDPCRELTIVLTAAPRRPPRRPVTTMPVQGTLQAVALGIVHRHGQTATRDFVAQGVPRQIVSLMYRQGVLERVGYGIYRAAPEMVRG